MYTVKICSNYLDHCIPNDGEQNKNKHTTFQKFSIQQHMCEEEKEMYVEQGGL
jgi:hypothetical protein